MLRPWGLADGPCGGIGTGSKATAAAASSDLLQCLAGSPTPMRAQVAERTSGWSRILPTGLGTSGGSGASTYSLLGGYCDDARDERPQLPRQAVMRVALTPTQTPPQDSRGLLCDGSGGCLSPTPGCWREVLEADAHPCTRSPPTAIEGATGATDRSWAMAFSCQPSCVHDTGAAGVGNAPHSNHPPTPTWWMRGCGTVPVVDPDPIWAGPCDAASEGGFESLNSRQFAGVVARDKVGRGECIRDDCCVPLGAALAGSSAVGGGSRSKDRTCELVDDCLYPRRSTPPQSFREVPTSYHMA